MDLELAGKRAIVTGASKGIGLAIVEALVAEGVHVVVGARTSSPGLEALGDAITFVAADLADPSGPARLVDAAGSVDILVNNVGGAKTRVAGFLAITDDEFIATMNLNYLAAVRTIRAVLPQMVERAAGNIVNVSSVNAFLPDPAVIDYSASKAALANFAKSISKEFGPKGIRVNAVAPGPVETDLWLGAGGVAQTAAAASGHTPEEIQAGAIAGTATGRFTHPGEVADLVVFLASARAANVTGASFTIDGGLIATL